MVCIAKCQDLIWISIEFPLSSSLTTNTSVSIQNSECVEDERERLNGIELWWDASEQKKRIHWVISYYFLAFFVCMQSGWLHTFPHRFTMLSQKWFIMLSRLDKDHPKCMRCICILVRNDFPVRSIHFCIFPLTRALDIKLSYIITASAYKLTHKYSYENPYDCIEWHDKMSTATRTKQKKNQQQHQKKTTRRLAFTFFVYVDSKTRWQSFYSIDKSNIITSLLLKWFNQRNATGSNIANTLKHSLHGTSISIFI